MMAEAYIVVKVDEALVPLVRMAIRANVKESTEIVFYEDGRQARFYGDDIPDYAEQRRWIELHTLVNSHVASAKDLAAKIKDPRDA